MSYNSILEQNQPVLGKNMINFLDYFVFGSIKSSTGVNFIISHWILWLLQAIKWQNFKNQDFFAFMSHDVNQVDTSEFVI